MKQEEQNILVGHDAHMTILLSLAQLLIQNKDKIKGTVKLLFQPDEEGNGGANEMIKNGALENPKVDRVFAIHVWSELKEDSIGIKKGAVMASTDPFEITVYRKRWPCCNARKMCRYNIYSK